VFFLTYLTLHWKLISRKTSRIHIYIATITLKERVCEFFRMKSKLNINHLIIAYDKTYLFQLLSVNCSLLKKCILYCNYSVLCVYNIIPYNYLVLKLRHTHIINLNLSSQSTTAKCYTKQ